MPRCNTEAINRHLAEIATQIAPGAHAAILVDQAGWRLSGGLDVPPNITLIPLPAKGPELNPRKTSGSPCAKTGSQTVSSNPTSRSSTSAARPGTGHRPALAHHVHRTARMDPPVLISESWY
jgi:hypothetical protein